MPIVNTNIHIQINVTDFIMNLSFIWLCEINSVESWSKGKIILVQSSYRIFQLELLVSYST